MQLVPKEEEHHPSLRFSHGPRYESPNPWAGNPPTSQPGVSRSLPGPRARPWRCAWGSMWGPLSAVALWVGAAAGGAPDGRVAAPATPFVVPFSPRGLARHGVGAGIWRGVSYWAP